MIKLKWKYKIGKVRIVNFWNKKWQKKGTVIRETEYLDSRKNVKISTPIQFQHTIIPKSVFLPIKFNKRTAKLSEHNVATCLVTSLKEI